MKKLLLLIMVVLLAACEPTTEDPPFELDCDIYPTHKDCKDDTPIDDPDDPIVDENYENLGFGSDIVYEGRDIVNEDCDHLDNIGEWQPVWCDEFNYTGLPNSELWNYDVGGHGWGNGELQYYTNQDEDNAFVENGVLTIRTLRETFNSNEYTSTRLISKNKGDWQYAKIQVRAQVPAGLGTWPAIWMLPTDWVYGGWPDSGEIDIMEYVGYDANTIHGTIHTGKYNHSLGTQVGVSRTVTTAEEEFHVYEMEWEVGVIRLYIDGVQYANFDYDPEDNTEVDSFEAWPFDQRFHLLLNTAFGGAWGGAQGVNPDILPVDFIIDYVRVFQKDYAGMDASAPEAVTGFTASVARADSLFLTWDHASDDVAVKQYLIYIDDTLIASTTVNGHLVTELSPETDYTVTIVAEDFAGNESPATTATFSTLAPPSINNRVEAEDYTTMSGVQTEQTSDVTGNLNVGWIDTGDSLTYILDVTESGVYTIDFRYASQENGANFTFYQGNTALFTIDTAPTGGWQNWQTVESNQFSLTPGTYTFRIVANNGGFNLNYFDFKKVN